MKPSYFSGSPLCQKDNFHNPINSSMIKSSPVLILFFSLTILFHSKVCHIMGKKERKKKDWVANSFYVGFLNIHKIRKAKNTSNYTHTKKKKKIKVWCALNGYTNKDTSWVIFNRKKESSMCVHTSLSHSIGLTPHPGLIHLLLAQQFN